MRDLPLELPRMLGQKMPRSEADGPNCRDGIGPQPAFAALYESNACQLARTLERDVDPATKGQGSARRRLAHEFADI